MGNVDIGQMRHGSPKSLKQFKAWVSEAELAHAPWRRESWTDSRMKDGEHWTEEDKRMMFEKGINPLTINRIFPIINLIAGNFANNQHDIVAVGRTQEDSEISQVMSEAIAFVMDQYGGYDMLFDAFNDQLVPGFGTLGVGLNPDPRKEKVMVKQYPWYSIWWDPYSDPWMNPESCRYAYYADWKDLDLVMAAMPHKRRELEDQFAELTSEPSSTSWVGSVDEGSQVEEKRRALADGSKWADKDRKRIRPVEMWYTVQAPVWFADLGPERGVKEIDKAGDIHAQFALVQAANSCSCAMVTKLRVATFVGNLLLNDIPSPLPHNRYPYIPFVGYLDSYRFPYGVPRQIREINMEVNKRRSMALSLISNRRVIMEQNTAEDPRAVYEQANRQDGLIILRDGKSDTFQIQELGTLAAPQIDLLKQSESEIQEITGANNESMGYKTPSMSEVALENKQQRSSAMTASLLKNLKKSQRMLGEAIVALVQDTWTGPKVLRVTDRVTGAEKFASLNDPVFNRSTGEIVINNNITTGKYDVVISDKPMTDTVREKNLELIMSSIQKSPPEAVPALLNLAFELSDLPNKDQLLYQIRSVLGVEPIDPMLSKAEAEMRARLKQQQVEEQQAEASQLQTDDQRADIAKKMADAEKSRADAKATLASIGENQQKNVIEASKVDLDREKLDAEQYRQGVELAEKLKQPKQKETA